MILQPGDIPCYFLLGGIQVPRAIGKNGSIIKELRHESGANVVLLDRPPAVPEALQQLDLKVAFISGPDASMHKAVTGLVRNARGPQSLRALEGDTDDEISMLVPESVVSHIEGPGFLDGIPCSLSVNSLPGITRHRRVSVRGCETQDLQMAAWRIHEVVIRLARAGNLTDKDFDLQDSSWDLAMRAFQAGRRGGTVQEVADAGNKPVTYGTPCASLLPEAVALESQIAKQREVRAKEVSDQDERDRRARVREAQAKEARDRHAASAEVRTLSDKAREKWEEANRQTQPDKYEQLAAETRSLELQAQDAQRRTMHGAGSLSQTGMREKFDQNAVTHAAGDVAQGAPQNDNPSAVLAPNCESGIRLDDGKGYSFRPTAENSRAPTSSSRPESAPRAVPHGAPAASRSTLASASSGTDKSPERPIAPGIRLSETDRSVTQKALTDFRQKEDRHDNNNVQATGLLAETACLPSQGLSSNGSGPMQSFLPSAMISGGRGTPTDYVRKDAPPMHLVIPTVEAARQLAGSGFGIAARSGATVVALPAGDHKPVLQITGNPCSIAVACYLVQEALWMSSFWPGV